jgi:hypothetical protein
VVTGWLVGLVGGYWLVSGPRLVDTGWLAWVGFIMLMAEMDGL